LYFLARIFSIPCTNISTKEINQIHLNINTSLTSGRYQIDCIKLIGHLSHIDFFSKEILINFKDLLIDDCLTDVIFQLDNEKLISSYRNILNIRCIYFNQLFNEYPLNIKQPIRIKNISYDAFYQILHFIFTDTIESILTFEICLELMRKADEFFLSSIYMEAFNLLKNIINKTNVFKIFMQSGLFSNLSNNNQQDNILLNDVVNLCMEFIRKNRRDVYLYDNMEQLSKDMLLQLIQLDL